MFNCYNYQQGSLKTQKKWINVFVTECVVKFSFRHFLYGYSINLYCHCQRSSSLKVISHVGVNFLSIGNLWLQKKTLVDEVKIRSLWLLITSCLTYFQVTHQFSFYLYVLPIVLFSILYNTPKFFELEVVWQEIRSPNSFWSFRSRRARCLMTPRPWGWLTSSRWPRTTTAATWPCSTCSSSSYPTSSNNSLFKQL